MLETACKDMLQIASLDRNPNCCGFKVYQWKSDAVISSNSEMPERYNTTELLFVLCVYDYMTQQHLEKHEMMNAARKKHIHLLDMSRYQMFFSCSGNQDFLWTFQKSTLNGKHTDRIFYKLAFKLILYLWIQVK